MPVIETVALEPVTIGRRMVELGFTVTGLVAGTALSAATITRARAGRPIGIAAAARIAQALRVPLGDLVQCGEKQS